MKILMADGDIHQETDGYIELTEKGEIKASQVYFRHKTLTTFLSEMLGVDQKIAEQDACLIEHDISSETMEKLAIFMQKHEDRN